jgi:hypothetical protein
LLPDKEESGIELQVGGFILFRYEVKFAPTTTSLALGESVLDAASCQVIGERAAPVPLRLRTILSGFLVESWRSRIGLWRFDGRDRREGKPSLRGIEKLLRPTAKQLPEQKIHLVKKLLDLPVLSHRMLEGCDQHLLEKRRIGRQVLRIDFHGANETT